MISGNRRLEANPWEFCSSALLRLDKSDYFQVKNYLSKQISIYALPKSELKGIRSLGPLTL